MRAVRILRQRLPAEVRAPLGARADRKPLARERARQVPDSGHEGIRQFRWRPGTLSVSWIEKTRAPVCGLRRLRLPHRQGGRWTVSFNGAILPFAPITCLPGAFRYSWGTPGGQGRDDTRLATV